MHVDIPRNGEGTEKGCGHISEIQIERKFNDCIKYLVTFYDKKRPMHSLIAWLVNHCKYIICMPRIGPCSAEMSMVSCYFT